MLLCYVIMACYDVMLLQNRLAHGDHLSYVMLLCYVVMVCYYVRLEVDVLMLWPHRFAHYVIK